jgi:ATP-binding cassette subfamily F protein 3
LFLDEPTNHLDIAAAEILEEALMGFEGTVLLVSHDRRFLENVTTRIVSVREGNAAVYPGGFRDFEREERDIPPARPARRPAPARAAREAKEATGANAPAAVVSEGQRTADEEGRIKYAAQRQAARALEKKKRRIQELESSIAGGERDLTALRVRLREAPGDDWERLTKMADEERTLARRVDAMLVEWARLSEETQ